VKTNNVTLLEDEGLLIDVHVEEYNMTAKTSVVLKNHFYILRNISCDASYVVNESYSISHEGILVIIEPETYIDVDPIGYCIASVSIKYFSGRHATLPLSNAAVPHFWIAFETMAK
jgi:hypothetical protein